MTVLRADLARAPFHCRDSIERMNGLSFGEKVTVHATENRSKRDDKTVCDVEETIPS